MDREPDPALRVFDNVSVAKLDLNPLNYAGGYAQFVDELGTALEENPASSDGICTALLCAGTYESGGFGDTSLEARMRLIGVNICGLVEILHAVQSLNKMRGVRSSSELSCVQVGSLHALAASPHRCVYVATKAFSLDLCLSLARGGEVKRAIYVAPGPIDTPMLHRNHWVSKEGGSVSFFEHVWKQGLPAYRDIFVQCDDAAFGEVVSTSYWDREELARTFGRYKERRAGTYSQPEGVLSAADMADCLSDIVGNESSYSGGVYVVTCPLGQMKVERLTFDEMVRR